jgi:predicted MFS family arabinose efflux permease
MALVSMLLPITLLKMRIKPAKARSLLDPATPRDVPYLLILLLAVVAFAAIYTPVFYISPWAIGRDYIPTSLVPYAVVILNAAVAIGRVVLSMIADRVTGIVNMCVILLIVSGLMSFCWIAISSKSSAILFIVIYGFCLGGGLTLISLTPVCFTADPSKVGTRLGIACFCAGIGILFGSPVVGALVSSSSRYLHAQIFIGSLFWGGALILGAARVLRIGWKLKVKF